MHLAELFQLQTQAVPQWALGSQFVQQRLGLIEGLRRDILALEQVAKAPLHLRFSKQDRFSSDRKDRPAAVATNWA